MPDRGTVLVADTEGRRGARYAEWLAPEWSVERVRHGDAAVDALGPAVDVVLLDGEFPEPPANRVLSYCRDHDLDCRVALVSEADAGAGPGPDTGADVKRRGVDDHLRPPLDRETLVDAVERLHARATYSRLVGRLYDALDRREQLRAETPPGELADSEQYEALEREIRTLRRRTDEVAATLDAEDYDALFCDLPGAGATRPRGTVDG